MAGITSMVPVAPAPCHLDACSIPEAEPCAGVQRCLSSNMVATLPREAS